VIPESFKQELLSRIDIVEVIDARVPLRKAGSNYSACCPFHGEKTASFTVSPSKQFYHCFGCGAHGNAISFLMEYGGLGYIEALRDLADQCGMKLPEMERGTGRAQAEGPSVVDLADHMARARDWFREQLKRSPRAIDYLKRRGLTGEVAARFGIGYAPDGWQNLQAVFTRYDDPQLAECGLVIVNDEGRRYDRFRDRIMFPIINPRGQVIGFGGRVIDSGEPKYLNSPETPLFEKGRELYGLPQARESMRSTDRVFVVEGYMDVVALAQHGVGNAVATLGTATTPTHVTKLLRQVGEIVFCFDGDRAGRKAAWHALEVALGVVPDGKMIRFLFLPAEDDPDTYVRAHGADGFNQAANESLPLSRYLIDELVSRHGADSAEGRSALLAEARPLLAPMKAPLLQAQLLQSLAGVGQMPTAELARAFGLGGGGGGAAGAPGGSGAGRRAVPGSQSGPGGRGWQAQAGGRGEGPARRAGGMGPGWRDVGAQRFADRSRPASEHRLERQMLRSLLSVPELAEEIPVELLPMSVPEAAVIRAVVAFLGEVPGAGAAAIFEHFREGPHAGMLARLQAELIGLDVGRDGAGAELRGAVCQMRLKAVDAELAALYARGTLDEDARERERVLRTLSRELREVLRSSSGAGGERDGGQGQV
jgi:DNA primase